MLVLQGKTSGTTPVLHQYTRYLTAVSGRRGENTGFRFWPG